MAKAKSNQKKDNLPKVNNEKKINKKTNQQNKKNAPVSAKNTQKSSPAILNGTLPNAKDWVAKTSLKLHLRSCSMKDIQQLIESFPARLNGIINIEFDAGENIGQKKQQIDKLLKGSRFQLIGKTQHYSENLSSLEVNIPQLDDASLQELKSVMKATEITTKSGKYVGVYVVHYDSPADAAKIFEAGSFDFQYTDSKNNKGGKKVSISVCPRYLINPVIKKNATAVSKPKSAGGKKSPKKNNKRKAMTDDQKNKKMKVDNQQKNKKNKVNGKEQ